MAAAMLDCKPQPDEGGAWKVEWFSRRYKGDPREHARMADFTVLSLDGAATAGGGDWSVLAWWGVFGNKARKLGQWRQQAAFPELLNLARDQFKALHPVALVIEKASAGVQVAQVLEREIPGVVAVPVSKSKRTRYNAVSSRWEAGNIEYPESSDWMAGYVERMTAIQGEGDEVDDEADADALFCAWWIDHGNEPSASEMLDAMRGAGWA